MYLISAIRIQQARMAKEANQLYRRPQMTRQATEDEEISYPGLPLLPEKNYLFWTPGRHINTNK